MWTLIYFIYVSIIVLCQFNFKVKRKGKQDRLEKYITEAVS